MREGGLNGLAYGNGVTLALGYDLDGRITAIDAFNGATPVLDLDYDQYDLAGNIRNITDVGGGDRGRTYGYDELHRLTNAQLAAPGDGVAEQIDYDYDPVGNRLTRDIGGVPETYDYDVFSNRLDSVTEGVEVRTLGYSASGNTESDDRGTAPDRTFVYDSTDRLVQVDEGAATLAIYAHNAMGQRVAKTVGGATTHFLYDLSGRIIGEADGATGATTVEYVALEGMPLAFIHGGAVYHVHMDHLGTPQRLTDGTGAAVWDASYAPFGETVVGGGVTFNLRFPGQYFDAETGLHYNYFRDYDSNLGRYLQSDPIKLDAGWNTYAYVRGNPVKFMDPTGEEAVTIATGAVFGAIIAAAWLMSDDGQDAIAGLQDYVDDLLDEECECTEWDLKYEANAKHLTYGRWVRGKWVSRLPTNGQYALDVSFPIADGHRLGLDDINVEIVELMRHNKNYNTCTEFYHGFVLEFWEDISKKPILQREVKRNGWKLPKQNRPKIR